MYLRCINVYSENEVCLRFISMEWNLFPSEGRLKKMLQLECFHRIYGLRP